MTVRRRGTYLTLLAIGAMALAVDRWILSDGATGPAVATALNPSDTNESPSAPGPTSTSKLMIPELPFPHGLETVDAGGTVRDLFAPPLFLGGENSSGSAADKDSTARDGRNASASTSATFMAHHRLEGVLVHERLRIAIVDGIWVRVGQTIDGCRLTVLSGNEARFTCDDNEATLHVRDYEILGGG